MKNIKLNIRLKLLLIFTLMVTVALAVFGAITLIQFTRTAEGIQNERLDSDLNSLTKSAAIAIDPEDVLQLAESGEEGDELYNKLQDQLLDLSVANPEIDSNRIYIAVRGANPGEVIILIDTEQDPQERFEFGEVYEPDPEFERMFDGFDGPQIDDTYLESEDGELFVTGYGPLHDVDGQSVAIIGVDLTAESVFEVGKEVISTFLITAAIIYPLSLLLVWFISGALARPVVEITDAAEVVERGDLFEPASLEKVASRSDEFGQLARVFSRMAVEVQVREKELKRNVIELEIQIDLVKKSEEVAAITSSDFFKDLQARAREMREVMEEEEEEEIAEKEPAP